MRSGSRPSVGAGPVAHSPWTRPFCPGVLQGRVGAAPTTSDGMARARTTMRIRMLAATDVHTSLLGNAALVSREAPDDDRRGDRDRLRCREVLTTEYVDAAGIEVSAHERSGTSVWMGEDSRLRTARRVSQEDLPTRARLASYRPTVLHPEGERACPHPSRSSTQGRATRKAASLRRHESCGRRAQPDLRRRARPAQPAQRELRACRRGLLSSRGS